jgi:hypothetical protein
MARILIFSPYAERTLHTHQEGTIARAWMVRGATIEYLLCDGLLPECDQHWDAFAGTPRPFDLCQRCQAAAKANLAELGFANKWLGDYVDQVERETAFTWAQSLTPAEMLQATFRDYAVGGAVFSSVASYFRENPPDFSQWRTVNVYRGFLYSAAITIIGLENFLELYSTEAAIVFNGRVSVTRVALELFRRHDIRVLTHEKQSYRMGDLNIKANVHCNSLYPFADFWREWGQIPLTQPQLEAVHNWLKERRYAAKSADWIYHGPYIPWLLDSKTA